MKEKIKQSLKYSLCDGVFMSVMNGMSESFIAPYAIAMNAGAAMIAMLSSVPGLVSALFQIQTAPMVEKLGSRKTLITKAVFSQALLWIPIIIIPYILGADKAIFVLVLYTLFITVGGLAFPAWSSLMADHVPETERGKVFGFRNKVFGFTVVVAMLAAGGILNLFKSFGAKFAGFTIIFSIAFVARLVSWKYLTKMYEPMLDIKDEHRFTFFDFMKRIRKSNFGRFVLFVACMNFGVYISAPFLTVYMLRDLKFDYMTYTVVVLAATLTGLVFMPLWGRHADRVGNLKILNLSSKFVAFVPLLWLVSPDPVYLIFVQIFAGFFWAGFNLGIINFMYDAVKPEKRTRCVAYFNVVNGSAIFLGALTGGFLSTRVPAFLASRIFSLFIVSWITRFLASGIAYYVKEVRTVKEISHLNLFYSIIGLRPGLRQALFSSSETE